MTMIEWLDILCFDVNHLCGGNAEIEMGAGLGVCERWVGVYGCYEITIHSTVYY
jgi:hypothetical protein